MKYVTILFLKIKNTLKYKHNLILLTALPALAAAGAWALLAFYLEGGANIPVGILDYDKSEFSKISIERFSENSTVGSRVLETGDIGEPAAQAGENPGAEANGGALNGIIGSAAYKNAARLVRVNSLEAVVVIMPGFEEKIKDGKPEGVFHIVCSPAGVSRGLVAELFAAQVSRLYFNCDSANRVVRDAETAARNAKGPSLTETERRDLFDYAYAYCDSYWEPEPLMSVEYEKYDAMQTTRPAVVDIAGKNGGWSDIREMLNDLLSRVVLAIFFTYIVFCLVNATGVMVAERASGALIRMRAGGFGAAAWISVSAAAPFILYGIPGAIIIAYLQKDSGSFLFAPAAFLCAAALGSCAAYIVKKPGAYKIFTLLCVVASAGASLLLIK